VLACGFIFKGGAVGGAEGEVWLYFRIKIGGRGWHHRISDGQDERPDQAAAGDLRALQLERTST
jgi:hypothetical protein